MKFKKSMMNKNKKRQTIRIKVTSFVLLFTQILQITYPTLSYGLTGGPSQPEVQSFEPVGTSEMVDLFSGDFNYNIPLLDVGGYPINIAYHAGVSMDQEASWVGLGWNINAGVINRSMRGLPDDFKGDKIKKEFNIRPNKTWGLSAAVGLDATEFFGLKIGKKIVNSGLGLNSGINYNNYKGLGISYGAAPSFSFGEQSTGILTAKLGLNYRTSGGFDVSPSLNFSTKVTDAIDDNKTYDIGYGANLGTSFNSRYGLQALNFGLSSSAQQQGAKSNNQAYGSHGKSVSGSHSFGIQTYTPSISMPMRTHAFTFDLAFGGKVLGTFSSASLTGTYSQQNLAIKKSEKAAYGYLYEHEHPNVETMEDHDFLLDFNRENDGSYSKNTRNLPLASHTYDIYSISGHGVGGSYRPFRSDIGIVGDDYSKTTSTSASGGIEIGLGNIVHLGANVNMTYHLSESGAWINDNNPESSFANITRDILGFRKNEIGKTSPDYEPSYFKKSGEMGSIDNFHYQLFKGDLPVVPAATNFDKSSASIFYTTKNVTPSISYTSNLLSKGFNFRIQDRDNVVRKKRDKRNDVFSYLNNSDREIAGQQKFILNMPINPPINRYKRNALNAWANEKPLHHTSEVTILGQDGMRYIYGIPAYNNIQKDKSFNISGCAKNISNGQAEYAEGDNTIGNTRGRDDFYSSTETPGYAHSYLLTGIVSNDYIDLTNNGITDDDYGTSVKINYSKVQSAYRWRIPYNTKTASLSEGLRHTILDDKGSYVYGEKEIWHMSTIESKTHVAFFRISPREDALGVEGEDGGMDLKMRSYKLDKIELYSKQEIEKFGINAKPVKTVHFDYDYSICPNVENNSGSTNVVGNSNKGKLTLKKIWFSYGTSHRGRVSPYLFEYSGINSQPGINPSYNLKGSDAWGTYKEMLGNNQNFDGNLSNSDFPYTDQDKAVADNNSFAWCLTQIQLPSGGKIKVTYESDDYAYVENKRAMEMVKITGFGRSEDHVNKGNRLFYKNGVQRHMDVIFFELEDNYNGNNNAAYIKKHYLEDIKYLQFTLLAKIKNNHHEYVKGYCEIDWDKGCGISANNEGWVAIKTVHINDKDVEDSDARHRISPLAKTIWNYAKMYTPQLIYPEPDNETENTIEQILSLYHVLGSDFYRGIRGINKSLEDQQFGAFISTSKSWLRLNSPNKKRLGGGHRVQKIEMSDEWQNMAYPSNNNATTNYGQEYDYTMEEVQTNGEKWIISSGVAGNLPALGGDEHPLVQPIFTEVKNIMIPDAESYNDRPIGETFFQGANVGYQKVTVKSLQSPNVKRTAAGYTINEFYTAYDYPTIVRQTDLYSQSIEPLPFFSMFQIKTETSVKVSQGYSIELNDMHGKPKAQYTFAEGKKTPLSWTKSIYQTDSTTYPNSLNNKVLTIAPDKTINEKEIGIEYDFVIDARKQNSLTYSAGIEFNTEAMAILILPIIATCVLPSYSKEEIKFRSSVGTKVIKKYAVLKETIAFQEGSTIKTSNLLYDDQTGEVLLTSVQNEFNDNVYNLTFPAHWAYDGMGQAYKNIGLSLTGVEIQSDNIKLPSNLLSANFLTPGDECLVQYPNGEKTMAWVYLGTGNKLNFIDIHGMPLVNSKNVTFKVIRSGRRNLHKSPIATFTTLSNPLIKTGNNYSLSIANVVNTEAIEYKETWKTHLDLIQTFECDTFGNDNYKNFVNFLKVLPNHQNLVKAKYSSGVSNFTRNDTDFTVKLYSRNMLKKTASSILYNDSVFLQLHYLNKNDSVKYYPLQFVEIAGVKNVVPRPSYLLYDGYDEFWVIVKPYNNFKEYKYINTMGSSFNGLKDSIAKKISYCGIGVPDFNTNNITVNYTFSSNLYNFKYHFHNDDNHCVCGFDLIFDQPNRINSILKIYDFKPKDSMSLYCKVVVELVGNTKDTFNTIVKTNCFKLMDCKWICNENLTEEKVVNPYRVGMYGNWRPYKSYKYLGERTFQSGSPNTRTDGKYTTFSSFWNYNTTTKKYEPSSTDPKWVNASEITAYTPFGNEVENKDALGNYSAAIFGYKNTLTTAVASNCRYNQLAFDGFEDYLYNTDGLCDQGHFNFATSITPNSGVILDNTQQHSGEYSLKVNANKTAQITRNVTLNLNPTSLPTEHEMKVARLSDDLGVFRPGQGKYIFGAWVKSEQKIADTTYNNGLVEIQVTDNNNNVTTIQVNTIGKIIEGWQRVEAIFEMPANTKSIAIILKSDGENAVWFDDVRVHTYDGNMKSYVYDAKHLKLRAELDENNYATFYEYDQEGSLIRVKKETEKGIVTLKETRNHVKGKN